MINEKQLREYLVQHRHTIISNVYRTGVTCGDRRDPFNNVVRFTEEGQPDINEAYIKDIMEYCKYHNIEELETLGKHVYHDFAFVILAEIHNV